MNEQLKELMEEKEKKKSDLSFLRSNEARIRREVYNELLDWMKEKWMS